MAIYDDNLTLGEARANYFAENGLGDDGNYSAKWAKLQVGVFVIYLPNIQARKIVLPFHDAHHVLTNYDTTWKGETEVAAWEIAFGCAYYWEAWWVNLHAVAIGLVLCPRRLFVAFIRGRQSLNLYQEAFDEALVSQKVGTLRHYLHLDVPPKPPIFGDYLLFTLWAIISIITFISTIVLLLSIIAALIGITFLGFWEMSQFC